MSIQTADDLSQKIREDLAWRRKENLALQSIVRQTSEGKQQAILRGAVAALYAHWEGFVKNACSQYLDYVKQRRLAHRELAIPLFAIAIRKQLQGTENSPRLDSHREFCEWLIREWDRRSHLPSGLSLFGTSNLTSDVLKAFIRGLGLPYGADYERAEKPIIDSLVELRNQLAHGAWQKVDAGKYDEFVLWITKLMDRLAEDIEDSVAKQLYKRQLAELT